MYSHVFTGVATSSIINDLPSLFYVIIIFLIAYAIIAANGQSTIITSNVTVLIYNCIVFVAL